MLKDSLYQLQGLQSSDHTVYATLTLDATHGIFNGHYPGQPVLPGACMLQMVKEVLENALDRELRLLKAGQLKFLSMVDPGTNPVLQLKITYQDAECDQLKVTASLSAETTVCFKFQGYFQESKAPAC